MKQRKERKKEKRIYRKTEQDWDERRSRNKRPRGLRIKAAP